MGIMDDFPNAPWGSRAAELELKKSISDAFVEESLVEQGTFRRCPDCGKATLKIPEYPDLCTFCIEHPTYPKKR